jgi:uncharacterized protein (UPF0303 family)
MWQLPISFAKCSTLTINKRSADNEVAFKLGEIILPNLSEVKDLGILVDNRLSFSSHISYAVKNAYQRANLIRRSFISKHVPTLLQAYKVYVRPLLEYK